MNIFTPTLQIALLIFGVGCLWQIARWFTIAIGTEKDQWNFLQRLFHALWSTVKAVFSPRIFRLVGTFITRVVLQLHILRQNPWRWLMHMLIAWPIILLVVFHAMDELTSEQLFANYAPTLNPFFMTRSLLGLLALIGLGMATTRRLFLRKVRQTTGLSDIAVLLLLIGIVGSGLVADSVQIVSEPIFNRMVEDYLGDDDPAVLEPLKAYWADQFHVVFEEPLAGEFPPEWESGQEIHEASCMDCHSKPQAAFTSLALAKTIKPIAVTLNRLQADLWLWYFHFGLSFFALALLPFTKLFHIIATPIMLLQQRIAPLPAHGADRLTVRALALSACTHCGVCSRHCSVAPIFDTLHNRAILPSEKIGGLKKKSLRAGSDRTAGEQFSHGNFICTECYRCTCLCPSGINLQDLWMTAKTVSSQNDLASIHTRIIDRPLMHWLTQQDQEPVDLPAAVMTLPIPEPETFSQCVQCSICASVCPVVNLADDPTSDPEVTPQQVMNLLRMEEDDIALASRMTWSCVTCYQCQEQCPQGIPVADILYSLRNQAWQKLTPLKEHRS